MAARPAGPGLLPGGLTAGGPPPGSIPVSMAGIPVSGKYNLCILEMELRPYLTYFIFFEYVACPCWVRLSFYLTQPKLFHIDKVLVQKS